MGDNFGWADRGRKAPGAVRRAPAPSSPAPTTSPMTPAGMLAIQRSAGNQAALAVMRRWAPAAAPAPATGGGEVIRRAWAPSLQDGEDRWDAPVAGLRWYRRLADDQYWFVFEGADIEALKSEELEEHPAEWWAAWEHAAGNWLPELAGGGGGAVVAEPVADQAGPVGDVAEPEAAAEAPVAIAAAAARQADPVVISGRAPQYAPGGAFSWPVTMNVTAVAHPSWVIQKVVLALDGEAAVTFYEAFFVAANATHATDGDIYLHPEPGDESGRSQVTGRMQHHVFDGDGNPPGFAPGQVRESDGAQWSSYDVPGFWAAGAGTQHDIDVQWNDDTGVITVTTVPNGGAYVAKESAAAFDA